MTVKNDRGALGVLTNSCFQMSALWLSQPAIAGSSWIRKRERELPYRIREIRNLHLYRIAGEIIARPIIRIDKRRRWKDDLFLDSRREPDRHLVSLIVIVIVIVNDSRTSFSSR